MRKKDITKKMVDIKKPEKKKLEYKKDKGGRGAANLGNTIWVPNK